jgi:acyl dehydratase
MAVEVTKRELEERIGAELGVSEWFLVDQDLVNRFADVTLDHQFVHVDPERARATPFRGTIAHGLLTLSLIVHLCLPFVPRFKGSQLVVNYGFDKVRFVSPVRVGSKIRATGKLAEVAERKRGQILIKIDVTIEIENDDKPALVAEWLSLHVVA